jgi:hypothetical protein
MYVYCNLYIYNIFFSNKNTIDILEKIEIEENKIKIIKKICVKSNIRDNICNMKQLQQHEMISIKNMSHESLFELFELLTNVNNNNIFLLHGKYMIEK